MKTYCGIEVKHRGKSYWYELGRLYKSKTIAEEAKESIERDNIRLVSMGSKWRIFELTRCD